MAENDNDNLGFYFEGTEVKMVCDPKNWDASKPPPPPEQQMSGAAARALSNQRADPWSAKDLSRGYRVR